MSKMLFIVPISNLVLENIALENSVVLLPHLYFTQDEESLSEDDRLLMSFGMGDLPTALSEAWGKNKQDFFGINASIAVLEEEFGEQEFYHNVPVDDTFILSKVCAQIDRELDYIRLSFCDYNRVGELPTYPGIIRGYVHGVVVNMKTFETRSLNGMVCTNLNQHGLGVSVDFHSINQDESLYKLLCSKRNDEVFLRCRSALRRVNQTYYFPNKDSIFIYLMSTLEFLASENYMKFGKVKAALIPFLAESKNSYHSISEDFRVLSEHYRTDVVHCGKSLFEIFKNEKEINKLLHKIIGYIVTYCTNVFDTGIETFNGLSTERESRIKKLNL